MVKSIPHKDEDTGSNPVVTTNSMYSKPIDIKPTLHLGYKYFCDTSHPLATGNSGRVMLHRHIASLKYNRWLTSKEHVHHIDGNKLNNDASNLEVLTLAEHNKAHKKVYVCPGCGVSFQLTGDRTKYCSLVCANTSRVKDVSITKELIEELKPGLSWVALGKLFGYSDNGIKKRAKALGCNL